MYKKRGIASESTELSENFSRKVHLVPSYTRVTFESDETRDVHHRSARLKEAEERAYFALHKRLLVISQQDMHLFTNFKEDLDKNKYLTEPAIEEELKELLRELQPAELLFDMSAKRKILSKSDSETQLSGNKKGLFNWGLRREKKSSFELLKHDDSAFKPLQNVVDRLNACFKKISSV